MQKETQQKLFKIIEEIEKNLEVKYGVYAKLVCSEFKRMILLRTEQ